MVNFKPGRFCVHIKYNQVLASLTRTSTTMTKPETRAKLPGRTYPPSKNLPPHEASFHEGAYI